MIEKTVTVELPESLAREFADYYRLHSREAKSLIGRVCRVIAAALPVPKPDEPLGLGAVVRDGGRVWVRADDSEYPWFCPDDHEGAAWSDFSDAVEVLSPGWTGADQ